MEHLTLKSPEMSAGSAETRLNFVGNAQTSTTSNRLESALEKILGELNGTSDAFFSENKTKESWKQID